eukprot:4493026-Amphidinium_carterae.1
MEGAEDLYRRWQQCLIAWLPDVEEALLHVYVHPEYVDAIRSDLNHLVKAMIWPHSAHARTMDKYLSNPDKGGKGRGRGKSTGKGA